ncbi:MAG: hypothetical protein ACI8Q1_000756 [Parvicella sp.]|jgi:hypothetical protein
MFVKRNQVVKTAKYNLNTDFQEFNFTFNFGLILKPKFSKKKITLKQIRLYFKKSE